MDLQTVFDNAVAAKRQEALKDSPQLMLGEIILKLEVVKNKKLPLVTDIKGKIPTGIDSWRGSYCELAILTEDFGSYKTFETEYSSQKIGKENPTVQEWIDVLKEAVGKTFTGYKGGDYKMSKNTPVWFVDEESDPRITVGDKYLEAYFVDVIEGDDVVCLITKTGDDLY